MKNRYSARKILSRVFVFTGIALFTVAVVMEAYCYPWGTLFRTGQDESSIADPIPIVLNGEDTNSLIEEWDGTLSDYPSEEVRILPGTEDEADAPTPVYFQLGILKIPKLNVSQFIFEGTQRQMRYGVGHVIGTDGIGATGNCAIAGHRAMAFRYLDKLVEGDLLVLKTKNNVYTYSVYDTFAVLPDETWVLSDVAGEGNLLTLITCTPYLVSTHRLIVRARLIDINGMTPEAFVEHENSTNSNTPIA